MYLDMDRLDTYSSHSSNNSTPDSSPFMGNSSHDSSHEEPECAQPAVGYLFWISVEIFTVALGLPANLRVLWALLRGEGDSTTSDIFLGSLAALDVIYLLLVPVHAINYLLLDNEDLTRALLFILGLNEIGSPLFLSSICLDRYAAVLHPVTFMRFRDIRYRAVFATGVWAFTLGYSAYISAVDFQHNDCIFIALFMAAFVIMIFCNLSILRALRQSGPGSDDIHPMKQRAFRTVLAIFIIVLFSFLPAAVIYPYEHILPEELFECYIFPICYCFITLRACLQPLLYLFRAGKLPCLSSTDHSLCCYTKDTSA